MPKTMPSFDSFRSAKGELAVLKVRHTYTMRQGPTEETFTYTPVVVERASLQGKVTKARDAWGSPADVAAAVAIYVVTDTDGAAMLQLLEREYDDLATARQAVRDALLSSSLRSEGK